jgi:hypothetical protein
VPRESNSNINNSNDNGNDNGKQEDEEIEELKRQIEEVKAKLAIYEEENPERKALNIEDDRSK